MFHKNRTWCVGPVATPEELAEKLRRTWTSCTGFELGGYLFLNDQLSEDGAGEWGVVKKDTMVQVESITFGWCSYEQGLEYIRCTLLHDYDNQHLAHVPDTRIQSREQHRRCRFCA
jgi:hypothetical protein